MRIFIIRHGIAEDYPSKIGPGNADDYRQLTKEGQEELEQHFASLRRKLSKVDLILSSPLVRAQQTAQCLRAMLGDVAYRETAGLRPEGDIEIFEAELRKLAEVDDPRCVAIVGHEPFVGYFTGNCLGVHGTASAIDFKKGGVCCIDGGFFQRRDGGWIFRGQLKWYSTPKLARELRV